MAPDTNRSDANTQPTEGSERATLRLVTQPTRAAVISDIFGHPEELPSIREFDYLNPDTKRSNIEHHLQQLIEAGIVEKVSIPKGERALERPSRSKS